MSKKHPSFLEYLNARGGLDEKPQITDKADTGPTPEPKDAQKKNQKMKDNKQPQVKEYLDGSGKLVEKPVVKMVADYNGPDPASPAASGPGLAKSTNERPAPYRAANTNVSGKGSESGLADKGAKNLKYEPDVDTSKDLGLKAIPSWPKSQTEQFLNKTKGMSLAEFSQYVVKECVQDVDAIEPIQQLAKIIEQKPKLINFFLAEVRRNGGVKNLLSAILNSQDGYDALTELLGENTKSCEAFARSLRKNLTEAVGPPIGLISNDRPIDRIKDDRQQDDDDDYEDDQQDDDWDDQQDDDDYEDDQQDDDWDDQQDDDTPDMPCATNVDDGGDKEEIVSAITNLIKALGLYGLV
jgi:hypothetical protein